MCCVYIFIEMVTESFSNNKFFFSPVPAIDWIALHSNFHHLFRLLSPFSLSYIVILFSFSFLFCAFCLKLKNTTITNMYINSIWLLDFQLACAETLGAFFTCFACKWVFCFFFEVKQIL